MRESGRFLLYARGEFQGCSFGDRLLFRAGPGACCDRWTTYYFNHRTGSALNNQATIPAGTHCHATNGRVMEAYVSGHFLNHEISFGKQDDWLGPGMGGGMAYSNNAENIYSFRINRIEPLHIPGLSYLTGPFRYDFLVGSLKGHVAIRMTLGSTWRRSASARPRIWNSVSSARVIWGGKDHEPITLHTFSEKLFQLFGAQRCRKVFARRSRRALWRIRLLLSAAVCPQVADTLFRLGSA